MVSNQTLVLYIEDDPASRTLVERTLRYAGYIVRTAERGLDGIDIARTEPIDLILTDINLPDITGRELTTMLRRDEKFATIPIVALTAAAHPQQRDLALAAGITGYLTKPIDIDALPQQVEYYLAGGRDQIDAGRMHKAQSDYTREIITHLEARIRELEIKNKALLQLDQFKDTFIQITAHELRTPLTLIYGYSRLLQDSPEFQQLSANQGDDSLIGGLVGAVERMQAIVDEILTISRIMTDQVDLSLGPTNLSKLMTKLETKYATVLSDRHLILTIQHETFPRSIRADGDMVEIVLDNLLSNAIKYTPDGGSIDVSARYDEFNVYVTFQDTGIGIDEADLDLIFERFHTVGDPQLHSTSKTNFFGGGLGLGLAICRGVVEAHGGSLIARSPRRDLDHPPGSEFVLQLPLAARANRKPMSAFLTKNHD
jgi:signal transduction histidine kinase